MNNIEKNENVENVEKGQNNKVFFVIIGVLVVIATLLGATILLNKEKSNGDVEDKDKGTKEIVRIDASLATQPLTDAFMKELKDFNLTADYTNTDPAYTKLIKGEVDLIVVTEPSKEELERAKNANVELEVTPVVNEGFVFYTNKVNPVNNLTLQQIQKIYTGEITNWKDVGGNSAEIVAYQRPVNSGSQTGILSLVMKGLKMKEPKKEEYIETMAGIIEVVSSYENGKDSIGYSYYYYATAMYGNDNLKFIGVDGIEPNHDTIKNSTYPLITSYYIVTLKDKASEETKRLKETLLSARGQEIARKAGYIEIG